MARVDRSAVPNYMFYDWMISVWSQGLAADGASLEKVLLMPDDRKNYPKKSEELLL